MAAEVALIGVATMVLEEGVKFLYEQAREVLGAWRARRRDPAATPPVVVDVPKRVTVGAAKSRAEAIDDEAIDTLQHLKDAAEAIKDGQVRIDDPAARQTIADLRAVLESALGAPITFAGEAPRPIEVRDVSAVVKGVRGRVTVVKAPDGGTIERIRFQADDVEESGDVTVVDVGGGRGDAS